MAKGLQELITKEFIHGKDRRSFGDMENSREKLKGFFTRYSIDTEKSFNNNSNQAWGMWRSGILSTWEFEGQSKVTYDTVFSGRGTNYNPGEENLSLSYFESQKDSVAVSYINEKIREVGFVESE